MWLMAMVMAIAVKTKRSLHDNTSAFEYEWVSNGETEAPRQRKGNMRSRTARS